MSSVSQVHDVVTSAVRAGMAAIRAFDAGSCGVETKADLSPVTGADRAAERAIVDTLAASLDLAVVAEESFASGNVPESGPRFLLVDPLDGTKSFIAGGHDYTVNVALIEDGVPVFGCVGVPAGGELYQGGVGRPATVERDGQIWPLRVRAASPDALGVVASRSHMTAETDAYLSSLPTGIIHPVGSSLKFCLIAEGRADVYPRFGPTMEWDTAAGDAILRAAGGLTVSLDGSPLTYGKRDRRSGGDFANASFIAVGDRSLLLLPEILRR